jgi:porphobilinogen deaminase
LARPVDHDTIDIVAVVVSLDGSTAIRGHARGPRAEAAALGRQVGAQLLNDGAGDILARAQGALGAVEGLQP